MLWMPRWKIKDWNTWLYPCLNDSLALSWGRFGDEESQIIPVHGPQMLPPALGTLSPWSLPFRWIYTCSIIDSFIIQLRWEVTALNSVSFSPYKCASWAMTNPKGFCVMYTCCWIWCNQALMESMITCVGSIHSIPIWMQQEFLIGVSLQTSGVDWC